MPRAKAATDTNLPEKEWEAARDVLAKFDDRRHDIRKYGISFVAGLLTAQSFIAESASITHLVKLAIVASTMVLIFSLRLTEKDYETYQVAAALRAVTIEPSLHYDLTGSITREYEHDQTWRLVDLTYVGLTGVAGILGYFLLSPTLALNGAAIVDIIAAIITGALILSLGKLIPTTKIAQKLKNQAALASSKKD